MLRPLSHYVLIREDEDAGHETTKGGLLVVTKGRTRRPTARGTVLRVGPGQLLNDGTRATPQVKEGDKVVFLTSASEILVRDDGEEFVLVDERDIYAVTFPAGSPPA